MSDIVSGPYWYAGPKFLERQEYYPAKPFDVAGYSENFLAYSTTSTATTGTTILIIGFPGAETVLVRELRRERGPLEASSSRSAVTDNESPMFTDVTGDGKPELVCMTGGQIGYAEIPRRSDAAVEVPGRRRRCAAISGSRTASASATSRDGRIDLLSRTAGGSIPKSTPVSWTFHEVKF